MLVYTVYTIQVVELGMQLEWGDAGGEVIIATFSKSRSGDGYGKTASGNVLSMRVLSMPLSSSRRQRKIACLDDAAKTCVDFL